MYLQKGYTFVAEARTTDQPLQSGVWRMRMIGSLSPLPAPLRNEVNCSFVTKEIRDYYVPNSKNTVFRYVLIQICSVAILSFLSPLLLT